MNSEPQTLRRRLLLYLFVPLSALLLLSLSVDYRIAFVPANEAYDHALMDDVIDLAGRVVDDGYSLHLNMSKATQTALASNLDDDEFMAVFRPDGSLLAGDPDLHPEDGGPALLPVLNDDMLRGKRVRKATYRFATSQGTAIVVIAETVHKRERAASNILFGLILPSLLLIALTLVIVHFGIRNGLRPLGRLGEEIGRRTPNDLTPLPDTDIPGEAAPLVHSINRLLKELHAASSAHEKFLADAAHQLKTPLAGLQTQFELLTAELPTAHQGRVVQIRDALGRLSRLTHQLLAFARSAPEALPAYTRQTVDLARLAGDQASFWFDRANVRAVDIEFRLSSAPVHGIEWLLRELMNNLIDNAIAHSGPGSHVTVRCGQMNAQVFFEVEDEGPGIAATDRPHIFERFYRAAGDGGGSGLGLAIVKEVAERHAASIALETPVRNDRGTCLRIVFPAQALPDQSNAAAR